jgi:hypothetical protein
MKRAPFVVMMLLLLAPLTATHADPVHCWMDGNTIVYSDQPPPEGVAIAAMPAAERPPVVRASDAPAADAAAADAPVADAAVPAPQTVVVSTTPATLDEILALSGFRAQLPAIARGLGAEYVARFGQLDDRDRARVAHIVARQFVPAQMFTAAREEFRRRVDVSQLNTMAAWFRSPLALKITALEIAASGPDTAPKIASYVTALKASPPSAARAELVQRLDWVTGTIDETIDLSLAVAVSVQRAAADGAPADRRPRAGLVERGVEETRSRITSAIRDDVFNQMLYIYAPLTDAELKAYVDFVASPAGRAFGRSVRAALIRVVRDVADRTARDIARAVPPQRWETAQPGARSAAR